MSRYELLINAIHNTDVFIVKIFLFAIASILAYRALEWVPAWMRRPAQYLYLAMGLALFVTVLFVGSGV